MGAARIRQLRIVTVVAAICAVSALVPLEAAAQNEILAFTNANVIDGVAAEPITDATVVVADGKIQSVETGNVPLPSGARVIDLEGRYLMPGLIDVHVHLRNFESARRALRSGVTTARSMGVGFTDVGLRELEAAGRIESPEILAAGYHIRPDPSDGFFIDVPAMGDLLKSGVRGDEAIRRMVRATADKGVNWIKTNATERAGLPDTDPRMQTFSEAELQALVAEAQRHGLPVAAHAHGDAGGLAAVRAGVRSIEHGTYLSEQTLQLMAERGTFLVPTIAVVADLTVPGGDYDSPVLTIRGRHMLPRIRETAAAAHRLGVRIAAATDTGYGPESTLRLSEELQELVSVGLTPIEAIRAATSVAAELIGVDDHTGRISVGLDADLIVLERNPLDDIGQVRDVLVVVNDGQIVLSRLQTSASASSH